MERLLKSEKNLDKVTKNSVKEEKGITLISLVITVIIMLILAGVVITTLTGDGGLFDKTLKSAEAFENAAQKESKQLEDLMNEIDGYISEFAVDKRAPSLAKLSVSNITDTSFTLTATAKDDTGIAKYEFYIKNDDGTFRLEKTIESEDTTVTYEVTGKTPKQISYVYKLKVYDKAGNSKESSEFLVEQGDTVAPTVATLAVSNIVENGCTLTATGEDDKGIAKYEFYIKNADGIFTLEKTITSNENTVTYNVTGKTMEQNSYTYKVKVYDEAGNSKESTEYIVGTKLAPNLVSVGDYINYDAGEWTQDDLDKITNSAGGPKLHNTVDDTTTGNQTLPTEQGQFGGFELGQSRNTNSAPYSENKKPSTAGWRVWNIDNSAGVVTLISAGHSESYYHQTGNSVASINILKNRDCTMYLNNYSTEAHILKGTEAATWYNNRFNTSYTLVDNNTSSTFITAIFTREEPISLLENNSYCWIACSYNSDWLYCVHPGSHNFSNGIRSGGMGVRVLITLNTDVLLELGTGVGTAENPWKIAENM